MEYDIVHFERQLPLRGKFYDFIKDYVISYKMSGSSYFGSSYSDVYPRFKMPLRVGRYHAFKSYVSRLDGNLESVNAIQNLFNFKIRVSLNSALSLSNSATYFNSIGSTFSQQTRTSRIYTFQYMLLRYTVKEKVIESWL